MAGEPAGEAPAEARASRGESDAGASGTANMRAAVPKSTSTASVLSSSPSVAALAKDGLWRRHMFSGEMSRWHQPSECAPRGSRTPQTARAPAPGPPRARGQRAASAHRRCLRCPAQPRACRRPHHRSHQRSPLLRSAPPLRHHSARGSGGCRRPTRQEPPHRGSRAELASCATVSGRERQWIRSSSPQSPRTLSRQRDRWRCHRASQQSRRYLLC
jgi:hypothetical protein